MTPTTRTPATPSTPETPAHPEFSIGTNGLKFPELINTETADMVQKIELEALGNFPITQPTLRKAMLYNQTLTILQ